MQRRMFQTRVANRFFSHARPNNLWLHAQSTCIPHPAKADVSIDDDRLKSNGSGEDAFFVTPFAVGVADGVGGWCETPGANAALYSRRLMHYCRAGLVGDEAAAVGGRPRSTDPVSILHAAHKRVGDSVLGSCTACVAVLDEQGSLRTANLGDSGFRIIRDGNILQRSQDLQHGFNFPYQLGPKSSDRAAHSSTSRVAVQKGDIVLLASDGVFDNVFEDEMLETVCAHDLSDTANIVTLSQQLAMQAHTLARLPDRESPFCMTAYREIGEYWPGGKMDDICVVVALVSDDQEELQRGLDQSDVVPPNHFHSPPLASLRRQLQQFARHSKRRRRVG